MQTITKADLIDRLTALQPRELVERGVERALVALGWAHKDVLTGAEVIALGTRMAEDAQAELAASEDPADRQAAEEMAPIVGTLKQDITPVLYPAEDA